MYEPTMTQLGLTEDQAKIYEALLVNGAMKAGKISNKTAVKRGFVYFLLEQLITLGLVEKEEGKNKTIVFKPLHPLKLKELAEKHQQQVKEAQTALDGIMPNLISSFNLVSGKPSVRFFEGKEGIIKVYEELLDENAPIDSIEDKGEMAEFIPNYFLKFIKKRMQRQIFNRVICPKGNPINKTDDKELRETRSISVKKYPLSMDIKIANNKVSLITFKKGSAVGVLIDHPEIAENFKILFKYMWDSLDQNDKSNVKNNTENADNNDHAASSSSSGDEAP